MFVEEKKTILFVLSSHVMNELLETERAYVEELLCVLEVSFLAVQSVPQSPHIYWWYVWTTAVVSLQGYAAEMDNPSMAHLIPSVLLSKKDILFGNMSEIYEFHKRYIFFFLLRGTLAFVYLLYTS